MLVNAVIYTFPPEKADEAAALLIRLRDASLTETGCLSYDVAQSIESPEVFVLHEKWADQAALDVHYATEHFTTLGLQGVRPLAVSRVGHRCRPL
jgi:quinol monooxygenase YgiN